MLNVDHKMYNSNLINREWSSIRMDIGVRWLLRQTGRPQTECRHMCMKLVYKLAPLIQGEYYSFIYIHMSLKQTF